MRLLVRRVAQRPASDWGRHTTAPNALETGHFKQTFTDFHILPTRYDTEKGLSPPPRPGNAPFSASSGPACGSKENLHFSLFFGYRLALTFDGGVAGGPSTVFSAVHPYGRTALLLPSGGTCRVHKLAKTKSGGGTTPRTFVGTPRGCGFHPSDVDG